MLIEKFYKILCFFIDTLVNAEKKAQKAENTSHLSSDSNSQEFLSWKRLKKKPSRFCNSSSDEENIRKEPLSLPTKRYRNEKITIDSKKFSTRPVLKTFPDINQGKTYICCE